MLGNFIIFGDSYSSHIDFLAPGGAVCYDMESENVNYRIPVTEMWWHKFFTKTGDKLLLNAAAGGSTICYTGWNGYNKEYSFIGRFEKLVQSGYFEQNKVDSLIVFGGTNDAWIPVALGTVPENIADITEEDKKFALPAIAYFFNYIKRTLPKLNVVVLINDNLGTEVPAALEANAKLNGFKALRLEPIDKINGHPTALGMTQISEQLLNFLKEN